MSSKMQPRDKWIPWYFVGLFVVVCSVNGVMAYLAIKTQTGVVTEHHYQKGLHYNQTIAQADKMAALGWEGEITFIPAPSSKTKGSLQFTLKDKDGAPVSGAVVTANIVRPTQDGHDQMLTLNMSDAGHYSSPLEFPLEGQWDVEIAVVRGEDKFQQTKRLVVR